MEFIDDNLAALDGSDIGYTVLGTIRDWRSANDEYYALASIYPGIKVGDHATIGMKRAAIKSVKPGTTVIGVPAKTIY